VEDGESDAGFALEVTRFTPAPVTESFPVTSLADLDAAIGRCAGEPEVVFGLVCDEGAGGAFFLFVAGGRGWVHLTAGPCGTARSRDASAATGSVVFRLDTGERREVAADHTVPREQGVQALRHWFHTEQQWPELVWGSDAEPSVAADRGRKAGPGR
jgi:hypothetical protein